MLLPGEMLLEIVLLERHKRRPTKHYYPEMMPAGDNMLVGIVLMKNQNVDCRKQEERAMAFPLQRR